MLFKGTKNRSAFDIASTIESLGGVINAYTGKEVTSFYVKVPHYHLPAAVDVLADMFCHARFDERDIKREKTVILQEINLLKIRRTITFRIFVMPAFGRVTVWGFPCWGEERS